ncbi:HAMP domain-containing histidine kinase [Pikeienuella piscinae]|uniref:histidine kinase n=1 Tax=Pikeienuella piscinae TaxID=2748098 RepID=A0A7L5BSF4_9RHOB|nr:HAMP domain-containing sensor histidine kinase [Pikeienuella piscinae]QIE54100.1 HAMP domain-containing histidine kinase [Pikeienuella piscinae]
MPLARSLSGRLLLLTVGIVMMTEVLVFLPSVARFREDYLLQRLHLAEIAALVLLASEDDMVEETLEAELLKNAGVSSIVLRRDSSRQLILQAPGDTMVDQTYDLRVDDAMTLIHDALAVLVRPEPRTIRVIGAPMKGGGVEIEITMAETPLCEAVIDYAGRILLLSLLISTVTGGLVFVVTRRLIVRPMERVVSNMLAFQKDPERTPPIQPSGSRLREIANAETALAEMQTELKAALRQKSRLADLGGAVAKISHDLRNMLASAQLLADRLAGSRDPVVARVGPKLISSLDRAVTLCVSTLQHGRAEEAPPAPRRLALRRIAADVGDAVVPEAGPITFVNETPAALYATVDADHLFRILANLTRNACQAIEATGRPGRVLVSAEPTVDGVALTVADDGPGLPPKALDNLFQPFRGGARRGGAGLGLAIAAELAALNGGRLELEASDGTGAVFRLTLPG